MNLAEKKAQAVKKMTGTGLYLFRNMTKKDIGLPKMSNDGKTMIPPNGCFRGDSYFKEALGGQVAIVEDLSGHIKKDVTLITEQPPTFTKDGLTETKVDVQEWTNATGDVLLLE